MPVWQNVARRQELIDDRIDAFLHRKLAGVDRDFGVRGRFVRVVNTGEPHGLALGHCRAGFGVHAFDVALFADVDGSLAIDLDEIAPGELPGLVPDGPVRADHGAQSGAPVLGDQTRDVADTAYVG